MPNSQCKKILAYLKEGNGITNAIAVDKFHCYRLAARISDLKKQGKDGRQGLWLLCGVSSCDGITKTKKH